MDSSPSDSKKKDSPPLYDLSKVLAEFWEIKNWPDLLKYTRDKRKKAELGTLGKNNPYEGLIALDDLRKIKISELELGRFGIEVFAPYCYYEGYPYNSGKWWNNNAVISKGSRLSNLLDRKIKPSEDRRRRHFDLVYGLNIPGYWAREIYIHNSPTCAIVGGVFSEMCLRGKDQNDHIKTDIDLMNITPANADKTHLNMCTSLNIHNYDSAHIGYGCTCILRSEHAITYKSDHDATYDYQLILYHEKNLSSILYQFDNQACGIGILAGKEWITLEALVIWYHNTIVFDKYAADASSDGRLFKYWNHKKFSVVIPEYYKHFGIVKNPIDYLTSSMNHLCVSYDCSYLSFPGDRFTGIKKNLKMNCSHKKYDECKNCDVIDNYMFEIISKIIKGGNKFVYDFNGENTELIETVDMVVKQITECWFHCYKLFLPHMEKCLNVSHDKFVELSNAILIPRSDFKKAEPKKHLLRKKASKKIEKYLKLELKKLKFQPLSAPLKLYSDLRKRSRDTMSLEQLENWFSKKIELTKYIPLPDVVCGIISEYYYENKLVVFPK
jgi:hypothetical protein